MHEAGTEGLRRRLTFADLYAMAVGGVIGVGIFSLPGRAAERMGPAAVCALLIGAVLVMLLVLCYAEAASRFGGTGGAMKYAQVAFGDLVAFEVGWATWVARVVTWGGLALWFVTSLEALFPGAEDQRGVLLCVLFAGLTACNLAGVAVAGRANTVLCAVKLVPLLAFIGIGVWSIEPARFVPFAPQGFGDLGGTTMLMLFAYVGFEGMVIPAGEMREPRRVVPRALLLGVATVAAVYLGVWAVCAGTLPNLAGHENPVAASAELFLPEFGATLIQAGIVVSVLGINLFNGFVTSRALYALGHERLLPPFFAVVDGRAVPVRAILLTSGLGLALALSGTFEQLAVISVVARIAQYIPTALATLRLRSMPEVPPAAFRMPWGPVVPVAAVIVCVWLLTQTEPERVAWGALAVAAGLPVYGAWRRRRPWREVT